MFIKHRSAEQCSEEDESQSCFPAFLMCLQKSGSLIVRLSSRLLKESRSPEQEVRHTSTKEKSVQHSGESDPEHAGARKSAISWHFLPSFLAFPHFIGSHLKLEEGKTVGGRGQRSVLLDWAEDHWTQGPNLNKAWLVNHLRRQRF
ncbi:hypothetical protein ElyMa_004474300 [Elysia marginata]|uniref:Uncharacterized protein n=1 Tax=Elysia marginata TaxID=1093978 RepID=A0AAV4HI82_9GAST|nr:hypothetical protein ElyMa_004474300 [Elysia marginata]